MLSFHIGALPAFIVLYAMMYAAFGVASPFWPRFFESRGLTPEQLGILLAIGTTVRLIAGPLAGRIADLLGALRAVLAICATLAAGMAVGLLLVNGFWVLLLVHMGQAAALAPITTLADALALYAAKPSPPRKGFEYGWVRGAASAAFVVGTLIAGQMLTSAELSVVVWAHAALLLGAVLAAAFVPALKARLAPHGNDRRSVVGGMRELLKIPV